jgi:hypothetical protein
MQQFQARVGRELHISEVERKIAVDTGLQIGFSSSHCWWPFVSWLIGWVAPPFNHKRKAFSISMCVSAPIFLTDQG